MQHVYFFGYGSLVNPLTHGYTPVHRARARGWRRAWRAVPERTACFLTAIPEADAETLGLIAPVPPEGWPALDLREAAYRRHDATDRIAHGSDAREIAIYAIAPERLSLPGPGNPILLSYLDVVIQGYLHQFGEDGPRHFFDSTTGWEAPILDDRAAPRYARAQTLSPAERKRVDDGLEQLGCRRIAPA